MIDQLSYFIILINCIKCVYECVVYDYVSVYVILDIVVFCYVVYVIDDQFYVMLIMFWCEGFWFYWYGSVVSWMIKII